MLWLALYLVLLGCMYMVENHEIKQGKAPASFLKRRWRSLAFCVFAAIHIFTMFWTKSYGVFNG